MGSFYLAELVIILITYPLTGGSANMRMKQART